MKSTLTSMVLTLACVPMLAAEPVTLKGSIGPYVIEVELDHDSMHNIQGRYRYEGRETWLSLSGRPYGNQVLDLTESADGEETGQFLLQVEGNGLTGYWVGAERDFPVALKTQDAVHDIFPPEPASSVGAGITGQYSVYSYWVNDWFAPNYEIGANGGSANVVELSEDEILVAFQFIVGPTYHFASFQGLAQRVGPGKYVHDRALSGGTETCRLEFSFDEAGLAISDVGNGFACQFGARAHANFDLTKVGDIAEFGDNW